MGRTDITRYEVIFSVANQIAVPEQCAAYRLQLCNGGIYHRCAQFKHLQKQIVSELTVVGLYRLGDKVRVSVNQPII